MTTQDRVKQVIWNQLGCDYEEIDDTTLMEAGTYDELDAIELVMALEDEFCIDIPDEGVFEDRRSCLFKPEFQTLGGITKYIQSRLE